MNKLVMFFVVVFVTISIDAQSNKDEINYIQSIWGMEKREIVKQNMNLSENESKDFWTAYDKYEESRKELGKERIKTIDDYAVSAANLTDTKAEEFAVKMLSNQTKFIDLLSTAYTDMKAVISQVKALLFIQIELYLDSVLKLKVMEEIPFSGQIKK